ncbi:MAG: FHA domain-containing protein [Acetatifactor sp.]
MSEEARKEKEEEERVASSEDVCNLAIPTDGAVSERHCEVSVVNNQFCLRDVGSSNGTMVNGQRITQMVEIKTGFIITLGRNEYRITLE